MKKINRETRIRISLIIGIITFFIAGLDSLDQGQLILAVSNLLFAIVNLASLYFIKGKESSVSVILLILNAGLAFIVSYGYYSSGKVMLPMAWLLVGLFYIVLSFITIKTKKNILSQYINSN
jgi:hypothetical protein